MRSIVDERLREEARRFRFVFGCPSCIWFDDRVDGDRADGHRAACALGFPNEEHVDERLEGRASVFFCKAFELA
jgi:hypothetical protein